MIGCADVTNPLLGPQSSAKVFGPQKGATPAQVKLLDKAMARWARVIKRQTGLDLAHTPSTAAAGAIAAGLYGCMQAKLLLGADFLLQKAQLEKYVGWADLLITSEGKWDAQTFYGKAPLAVLKLAQKKHKPVLFICGTADWKALKKQALPQVCVAELADFAPSIKMAKKYAYGSIKSIRANQSIYYSSVSSFFLGFCSKLDFEFVEDSSFLLEALPSLDLSLLPYKFFQ